MPPPNKLTGFSGNLGWLGCFGHCSIQGPCLVIWEGGGSQDNPRRMLSTPSTQIFSQVLIDLNDISYKKNVFSWMSAVFLMPVLTFVPQKKYITLLFIFGGGFRVAAYKSHPFPGLDPAKRKAIDEAIASAGMVALASADGCVLSFVFVSTPCVDHSYQMVPRGCEGNLTIKNAFVEVSYFFPAPKTLLCPKKLPRRCSQSWKFSFFIVVVFLF